MALGSSCLNVHTSERFYGPVAFMLSKQAITIQFKSQVKHRFYSVFFSPVSGNVTAACAKDMENRTTFMVFNQILISSVPLHD